MLTSREYISLVFFSIFLFSHAGSQHVIKAQEVGGLKDDGGGQDGGECEIERNREHTGSRINHFSLDDYFTINTQQCRFYESYIIDSDGEKGLETVCAQYIYARFTGSKIFNSVTATFNFLTLISLI